MNCVPYKCYDYDHWFYGIAYGKADAEANHLTGNNCAEFGVGLLDSYFFKLSLGSDSLVPKQSCLIIIILQNYQV